jgi:hypothetical protein
LAKLLSSLIRRHRFDNQPVAGEQADISPIIALYFLSPIHRLMIPKRFDSFLDKLCFVVIFPSEFFPSSTEVFKTGSDGEYLKQADKLFLLLSSTQLDSILFLVLTFSI